MEKERNERITEADVVRGAKILREYISGKANLDARVIEDERWWKGQHWAIIRQKDKHSGPEPTSRWLFNAITNKHADLMDNFPEAVALPREESDCESARLLSDILPVVFRYNDFETTYADNCWELLKHGTAVYGAFWDPTKDGIGDIAITAIDLLRIYWQPGITDVQDSRNLFILDLVDTDLLEERYPHLKGEFKDNALSLKQYDYDDSVDIRQKTVVVDWYYKKPTADGRVLLHYIKFAGSNLLYASENDPTLAEHGFYDHGKYPVVFHTLFPEKGTPAGFGEVAICKDPQLYIDKLMGNILETSLLNTKRRFFAKRTLGINREQLLDNNDPLIEVEGDIDDSRLREFEPRDLSAIYANIVQMKVDEMKDTSSNRDVNSGGTSGGVTAASAIAALQEAGNKNSRDIIMGSYRSFIKLTHLVIELMRQFYDEPRSFRITGGDGETASATQSYGFASFSGTRIRQRKTGVDQCGEALFRKPIFDVDVRAQKQNPFSVMSQNELAKELLAMGAFDPDKHHQLMMALMIMRFDGKRELMDYISRTAEQTAAQVDEGGEIHPNGGKENGAGKIASGTSSGTSSGVSSSTASRQAKRSMTPGLSYTEALVKRTVKEG